MKDILKTGVLDYVMDWATTKSQRQLQQKSAGKKGSKIKGESKLSDAKDAGTARSKVNCFKRWDFWSCQFLFILLKLGNGVLLNIILDADNYNIVGYN